MVSLSLSLPLHWTSTYKSTRSTNCTSGSLLLSTLLESLLTLLFALLGRCSLRVPKLRVILKAIEIILHVPVEERGMHGLGESIYKHVICWNPPDAILEILNAFTNI